MKHKVKLNKTFYTRNSRGIRKMKYVLEKDIVLKYSPPYVNTHLIFPNGEGFFVETLYQLIRTGHWIATSSQVEEDYNLVKLIKSAEIHIENGWKIKYTYTRL